MGLKKYQQGAIDILNDYLKELKKSGAKRAFIYVKDTSYKEKFFGEVPFICIKMPTGGGKTLVACHSVTEILDKVLESRLDKGIVMWFTPSEAIKTQTLNKLKDRDDIHRRVFDEYLDNRVRVFSNEEALRIRKEDVENNLCIVVSSLDAFRKDKSLQSKYKVYKENGELLNHFEKIQDEKKLEKDEEGTVINSLANVIRMNSPLIVIDEGHRTKTELSIEFLKDLNPSFIIEFTATPRQESNILVEVHSSELKEEKMVKIPIILENVAQWQQAVTQGVLKRKELEEIAKKEKGEYIRPIALLQAEQEKESKSKITVDELKEFLIKEHKIPEEQVAVKTSSRNELEGVNLFDKKCEIRYIITVNALAEGWDCSFAYLLISVANIGSKISVEQIIGRIVRLPNQKIKKNEELNYSYVFASQKNFNEAANQIISDLEKNGYSRADLINSDEKSKKYELEINRAFKEDFAIPVILYEGQQLEFSELLGETFELAKEDFKFEFKSHYDSDGIIKIDVLEGDKWVKERQTILHLAYSDKNFSKKELVSWLDKRLRFIMLDKSDRMKFLEKAVDYQLNKHSLSELSINRFVFRDCLEEVIKEILEKHAKKAFNKLVDGGKISVGPIFSLPETIIVSEKVDEKFKRGYYQEIDKLNNEELEFVERLDGEALPNIKFWFRNKEKKEYSFYLQGWKRNKFYPDFAVLTKKGNILILEWKGKDRVSNQDTDYKGWLGQAWEKLGNGKLHFFLVHKTNAEEVLNKIKEL